MTVTKLWHFDASEPFQVDKESFNILPPPTRTIFRIGNIANNARLSAQPSATPATASSAAILSSTQDRTESHFKSRWVGQPTDVAVLDLLDVFGEEDIREQVGARLTETPFSSERKWMGVVVGSSLLNGKEGQSEIAYIKGALEQVLQKSDTYLTKDGREVILDDTRRNEAISAAKLMADEGLRMIAFASGGASSSRLTPKEPDNDTTSRIRPITSPFREEHRRERKIQRPLLCWSGRYERPSTKGRPPVD